MILMESNSVNTLIAFGSNLEGEGNDIGFVTFSPFGLKLISSVLSLESDDGNSFSPFNIDHNPKSDISLLGINNLDLSVLNIC